MSIISASGQSEPRYRTCSQPRIRYLEAILYFNVFNLRKQAHGHVSTSSQKQKKKKIRRGVRPLIGLQSKQGEEKRGASVRCRKNNGIVHKAPPRLIETADSMALVIRLAHRFFAIHFVPESHGWVTARAGKRSGASIPLSVLPQSIRDALKRATTRLPHSLGTTNTGDKQDFDGLYVPSSKPECQIHEGSSFAVWRWRGGAYAVISLARCSRLTHKVVYLNDFHAPRIDTFHGRTVKPLLRNMQRSAKNHIFVGYT